MPVDQLLTRCAERRPDREALVSGSRRLLYGQLEREVTRVAAGFRALGLSRGDRVAVHLENGIEAVLSILGALRAGAVFVPINPTTKGSKLGYLLADSQASLLVSDRRSAQAIAEARDIAGPSTTVVMTGVENGRALTGVSFPFVRFEDMASAATDLALPRRIDLDLAALIYTSGSTGKPKGVMMTHANILAATTSINDYLRNGEDDTILDVLPLSFDYGLYQLFLAMDAGARLLLERSFAFPTVMLELMARERVTALPIVPMVVSLLLKHDLSAYDLGALRYLTNTGAVLPPAHIAALRVRLPHVRIFSMYGLTECKRVSFLDPDDLDARPTSVGKPMTNVDVYLVDEDGTLKTSGVGELVIRGSNVMQGYWRAPEDTARALRPGPLPGERVLYTGDTFRIDDDGYMYFQGRTDDIIKSRGQKVSPKEIENVLHAAAGVSEAVVVGVPDELAGEVVKAFVTLHADAKTTDQELLQHCARHLEDFMVPKSIEIVASLPHTSSGKLARREVLQASVR